MLLISFLDRIGSGLWSSVSVLYFTYVSGLSIAQVGTLAAVSGAIGIAGAPLAGRLADRFPLTRIMIAIQLLRALASFALLTTDHYLPLLALSAVGALGDRASNLLTRLYATRVAGPDRARYQAFNRTAANAGWALGGLAAAAALTLGTTTAYRWLLTGDGISFVTVALLTLTCAEPRSSTHLAATAGDPLRTRRPANPWRDRTYLAYVATETVLFLDDTVFKVGLPLWIAHRHGVPHGLAPLLLVLNNALVVGLQVPLARYGTTAAAARRLLIPLSAAFALGGVALALSATGGTVQAVCLLSASAAAFTLAEMLHATVSWELSVALAPDTAQGAYLGVHGLAQAAQRSIGPLAVTAAIATGPLGWTLFGTVIALTCAIQHRLVRDRIQQAPLSVPLVTLSEH
ncbi:MFS transporter [Streptomyces sp. NBC_00820]|uniref:MFS transporter n=1 Tax=Streptomyces sp. NBC_00820 TaxID=2975842 RepID=UPI002ECFE5E8|nr:MFS transporter [Streptomyces sp. NBC_00820]